MPPVDPGPPTFWIIIAKIPWAKIYKAEILKLIKKGLSTNGIINYLKKKYNK